ncbi:MAG: hypothetical protein RR909_01730 [Bacilli bacterium]
MKKFFIVLSIASILSITSCTFFTPPYFGNSSSSSSSGTDSSSTSNSTLTTTGSTNTSVTTPTSSDTSSSSSTTTSSSTSTSTSTNTSVNPPLVDPYANINTIAEVKDFYKSYTPSTSYEDAQFRTKHMLISGSSAASDYKVALTRPVGDTTAVRNTFMDYTYRDDGSYESYKLYSLNKTFTTIYYGGGYSDINEVAAYLFAFGEVPPNVNKDKAKLNAFVKTNWWRYARVNDGYYSGPSATSHIYEPYLYGQRNDTVSYNETDFGDWEFFNDIIYDKKYTPTTYIKNSEGSISGSRGNLRFLYTTADKNPSNKNDFSKRRVYFTFNHYNDFVEYLNYRDGFGQQFGNMTKGNEYCAGTCLDDAPVVPARDLIN